MYRFRYFTVIFVVNKILSHIQAKSFLQVETIFNSYNLEKTEKHCNLHLPAHLLRSYVVANVICMSIMLKCLSNFGRTSTPVLPNEKDHT